MPAGVQITGGSLELPVPPMLEVKAGRVRLAMEEEGWVVAKTPRYCSTVAGCIVFPHCAVHATPASLPTE